MDCLRKFGSFPNSRLRPRKPTKNEDTMCYQLPAQGTVGTVDTSLPAFDDTLDTSNGELTTNGNMIIAHKDQNRTFLTLRNAHSGDIIRYGFFDRVDLATTGMPLRAGDAVDIDGPEMVYIASNSDEAIETCKHWGIG